MTADIITVGHIMFLEEIADMYKDPAIYIGLLTDTALRGYKRPIMDFRDREYIVRHIRVEKVGRNCIVGVWKQTSLNPYKNMKKLRVSAIGSGDGFEQIEISAAKKLGCKLVNIQLPIENKGQKYYSSTAIKQKIKNRRKL